jgi:hypothetical protein
MVRERVSAVLEPEREVALGGALVARRAMRGHDAVDVAVREHGDVALVRVLGEQVVKREVDIRDQLDTGEPQHERRERERCAATSHPW